MMVKVGNKSTLRLREVEVYRAITVDDMEILSKNHSDIKAIIVENVRSKEYNNMRDFLSQYKAEEDNHVFFYCPDDDEVTTGLADELDIEIYMTSDDLYRSIEVNCGMIVNPDLYLHKEEQAEFSDGEDDFDSMFDNFGMIDSEVTPLKITKDLGYFVGKSDLGVELTDEDFEEPVVIEEIVEDQPLVETIETEDDSVSLVKTDDETTDNEDITATNDIGLQEVEIDIPSDTNTDLIEEPIIEEIDSNGVDLAELESLRNELQTVKDDFDKKSDELAEKSQELQKKTAEAAELSGQIEDALNKIRDLNKVIKAVKDERDNLQTELSSLETAEVIDDPDTIDDLDRLKNKVQELENRAANSADITDAELKSLREENERIKGEEKSNKETISELNIKLEDFESQVESLTSQLALARNDTSKSDKIAELAGQIEELDKTIGELRHTISDREDSIEEHKIAYEMLNGSLIEYQDDRDTVVEMLNNAARLLLETSELSNTCEQLESDKAALEKQVIGLNAALSDRDTKLNKLNDEVENRVRLARNFASEELENLKAENKELREQYRNINASQTAYDGIMAKIGSNANEVDAFIRSKETLEQINTNLMKQIDQLKTENKRVIEEKSDSNSSLTKLQNENNQLRSQMRALTSGYTGGAQAGVVSPIAYSGRANIVTVIGSGSYGITTSAYSAALILAQKSRVLFIDFDLCSAKADGMFRTSPMYCQNATGKRSALGVIMDQNVQYFLENFARMMPTPVTHKNGGSVTYMSGLYENADVVKLVSSDYTGLMSFFGNTFDYIVIDMGRLGTSDINNSLIKVFSYIGRLMIVTSSDKSDIRNMRLALQTAGIDTNNAGWMINMCENTKLDDRTKSLVVPAKSFMMPFLDDFYGKHKDFTNTRVSRDKFKLFLDTCVFRRG